MTRGERLDENDYLTDEQVAPFAEVMAQAMGDNAHAWLRNEGGSWRSGPGTVAASLRAAHIHAAHGILATGVVVLPPGQAASGIPPAQTTNTEEGK